MTTIITKNGSGAPTAGQLSQGELAVDLTNKELYTKDSGGNVIKVGAQGGSTGTFTDLTATSSFTSPGIDDNATSTAITIDSTNRVGIGAPAGGGSKFQARVAAGLNIAMNQEPTAADDIARISAYNDDVSASVPLAFEGEYLKLRTQGQDRVRIDSTGNVGIGTSSPLNKLVVSEGTGQHGIEMAPGATSYIQAYDRATSDYGDLKIDGQTIQFGTDIGAERMRITADGNVGIGTDAPLANLDVSSSTGPATLYISNREQKSWTSGMELGRLSYYVGDTSGGGARDAGGIRATNQGNSAGPTLELGFFTSSTYAAPTEAMRIDADGNVGIGTTEPDRNLHVSGTTQVPLGIESNQVRSYMNFVDSVSANGGPLIGSAGDAFVVANGSNNSEKFRITDDGNVGIGTNNPQLQLDVRRDAGAVTAGDFLALDLDVATTGTPTTLSSGIRFKVDGVAGARITSSASKDLIFKTDDTDEAMRIDASGNVLVGKTSAGFAVAGCRIQPTGDVRISKTGSAADTMVGFYKNGSATNVGTITSTSTATSYNTSSDERLKDNITDSPAGNIDSIKVRSFDWKADGSHQEYGFIAQELETVAPYAVSKGGTDEDTWGVDYSKLVPMLVKEIQDLKAEVAALKGA